MTRGAAVACVVLAMTFAAAASAAAGTGPIRLAVFPSEYGMGGPWLLPAGAGFTRIDRSRLLVETVAPGQRPRTRATVPLAKSDGAFTAMSDSTLAIEKTSQFMGQWESTGLLAGRLGGHLDSLPCGSSAFDPPAPAVVGATVASACDYGELVIRDLETGRSQTLLERGDIGTISAAGHYLAYLVGTGDRAGYGSPSATQAVLYDLGAQAEVFRADVPGIEYVPAFRDPLSVEDDGTMVVTAGQIYGPDEKCPLATWLSIAEPRPHPLAACPAPFTGVAIAGGRVIYYAINALVLGDLTGSASPQTVAQNVIRGPAFDGHRLAWIGADCLHTFVAEEDVDSPAVAMPLSCPVKIVDRDLRADRHASVSVHLRCPQGCSGRLRLEGCYGLCGPLVPIPVTRRGSVALSYRLSRNSFRLLRRRGHLSVEVRAVDSPLVTNLDPIRTLRAPRRHEGPGHSHYRNPA